MVKINEFHDMDIPDEILPKPDWNVGEDLLVFMRNDPMFYRKTLFPAVDDYKRSKDNKVIIRVVKKGLGDYCNRFGIPNPVHELMSDGDIQEVAKKIIMQDVHGRTEEE